MVATPGTTSPHPPGQHRLTVLLANEPSSPGTADACYTTVRSLLAPLGVRLLTAHTGREALHLMESSTVHVAILDHRMPQLGGLQVIKLVREHLAQAALTSPSQGEFGGIPPGESRGEINRSASSVSRPHCPATILLADHLTTPLLHEALGMSVFSVLPKPVNYPQLLDTLARALKRFHNSQWPA